MINRLTELSNPNSVINKNLGRHQITVLNNQGIKIVTQERLVDELIQKSAITIQDNNLNIKGQAYIPYYESSKLASMSTSIILKTPQGNDIYFTAMMNSSGYGVINNYDYAYSGFEANISLDNFSDIGDYQLYIKMTDKTTGHTVIKKLSNLTNDGDVMYRNFGNNVLSVYDDSGIKIKVQNRAVDSITQEANILATTNELTIEGKAYIPNYEMIKAEDVSIQIILKNPSQKDYYFNVERNTSGYGMVNGANYAYSGYKVAIPSNYLGELGTYQLLIKMVDKTTGHTVIKNLSNLSNSGAVNQQLIGKFLGTVKENTGIKLSLISQ